MASRKDSVSISSAPDQVFLDACNVYFRHCHNKPYSFFNAILFDDKVHNNQVPLHLRLALIASATRYSSRSQWKERKQNTIDGYARCSWELITASVGGIDERDDVTVIQSLALLGVIDATAGRRRHAWVKIGMAMRLAQDMQMMLEPSLDLSELEQDERRNLFWSLYLLDRFICCSFQRPPGIHESDCLLNLATHYRDGKRIPPLTLEGILEARKRNESPPSGMFGVSTGLAALLGRTVSYMMKRSSCVEPPWDSNSTYDNIYSDLEYLKELAVKNGPILAEPSQARPQADLPDPDREQIAHMVLSHTIYHLANCILGHPFLVALKIKNFTHNEVPEDWLEETRTRCLSHAGSLITVLVEAKAAGYMPIPSVYSYCMLVASTVHALFIYNDETSIRESSAEYLRMALDYLAEMSELWDNAQIMSNALKYFVVQCSRYSNILVYGFPRLDELTETELSILKSVVDYWTMMDPNNPVFSMEYLRSSAAADLQETSLAYMTPPQPVDMHNTSFGGITQESTRQDPLDPDILLPFPASIMSPMPSDHGVSPRWDWDHEINAMRN